MADEEKQSHLLAEGEGPKVEPVIDGWWTLPPEEQQELVDMMEKGKAERDALCPSAPDAGGEPPRQ